MNVADAKPYSPSTDGAANGCSMTRGRANPSSHSEPLSTVTTRRASLAITCLLPLLLRDHRVARVARRLESRLEHRPPQRELAREDQGAARDRRRAAPLALPREEDRAGESAGLRRLVELAGGGLLVDLADEAEPLLHHLHEPELRRDARERGTTCRIGIFAGREHHSCGARTCGCARAEEPR